MKILTWNLGLFFFYKYYKSLGFKLNGTIVPNEYFQQQYADFVISYLREESPDICFLQELYSDNERNLLREGLMDVYPYSETISTWYHEHSILIFSKNKINTKKIPETEFSYIKSFGKNFIPIHLNSFSPRKRYLQIDGLLENSLEKIDCIIGDTNFWSHGNMFLARNDRKSYLRLSEEFKDTGKYTDTTSKAFLNLDRVFVSKEIKIQSVDCPPVSEKGMDHFPVIVKVK